MWFSHILEGRLFCFILEIAAENSSKEKELAVLQIE